MIKPELFEMFATYARGGGVDGAVAALNGVVDMAVLEELRQEYERIVLDIEDGKPAVIFDRYGDGWYTGPLDHDRNWNALKKYFSSDLSWVEDRVAPVNQSSSKVIAYTPQPKLLSWTSKGLVVGYVQSGKTTNFTAVISKAADLKYRLVIVLSGIHNGLRRQTQDRLATQLMKHNPNAWIELTTLDDDFNSPTMKMASLLNRHADNTALAVVKKNKAPLKRLLDWIQEAADQNALADLPVLIIDDEADQASVATKTINPLIMNIIAMLPKCTYIGYTATPFANVLIDPAAEDLYPSDFILNLPRPAGYFGTERVFGRDLVEGDEANGTTLDGYDMVRIIDDNELPFLRPPRRKDIPNFEPEITASLRAAILWFWLATAARRARNDDDHSSMLIHTHLNTDIHDSFKAPLVDFRDNTLRGLKERNEALLEEFSKLWDAEYERLPRDDFPNLEPLSFDDVSPILPEVIAASKVVIDNSASADRLDYSQPSQIAIAVGGNTLSRGLTLEGLVVSFFVRTSTAYDTLLQMARWFGFRPGYEDMPRIWMTDTLREWFRHLATVESEIRLDIDRYERQGLTPTQFGVRIRTHPKLAVTAKMGAAKPAASSFSDQRVQTRYFIANDVNWLQDNIDAADRLITDARADGSYPERDQKRGAVLFRDVHVDRIFQFLNRYNVHEDSPDLNTNLLSEYIRKELENWRLHYWNIAVVSQETDPASASTVNLGGISFGKLTRAKLESPADRADIKTLMSKEHRVIDLSIEPSRARQESENALRDLRNSSDDPRGLIALYPIDPASVPANANKASRRPLDAAADVIGLALVFPESSSSKDTFIAVDLSGVQINLDPANDSADLDGEGLHEAETLLEEV